MSGKLSTKKLNNHLIFSINMFESTNTLKVRCKACGRMDSPDNFKLDYRFNTVVCSSCIKDKDREKEKKEQPMRVEPVKPAGWDNEDLYLEKAYKEKKDTFSGLSGITLVKCRKCSFKFNYNIDTNSPKACPYCDSKVKP